MRSPGVIYRKYRQLKRKYLYEALVESRKKRHENCSYGKLLKYIDSAGQDREVRLCVFGSKIRQSFNLPAGHPGTNTVDGLDVCTCPVECSAFASKWSKEEVTKRFESIVGNQNDNYPELRALQWVLDKPLTDAVEKPTVVGRIIVWCIKVLEDLLKFVDRSKTKLG
jgi:hypothetical protein